MFLAFFLLEMWKLSVLTQLFFHSPWVHFTIKCCVFYLRVLFVTLSKVGNSAVYYYCASGVDVYFANPYLVNTSYILLLFFSFLFSISSSSSSSSLFFFYYYRWWWFCVSVYYCLRRCFWCCCDCFWYRE